MAERKGVSVGWWRFYAVMAWIGGEIFGVVISLALIGQQLFFNVLTGIAFAFGGYLLVKYRLDKIPDKEDGDWVNNIGKYKEEE